MTDRARATFLFALYSIEITEVINDVVARSPVAAVAGCEEA